MAKTEEPDLNKDTVTGDGYQNWLDRFAGGIQKKPVLTIVLALFVLFGGLYAYEQKLVEKDLAFEDSQSIVARGSKFNESYTKESSYVATINNETTLSSQEISPFTIEAEDYDEGGQGESYFDTSRGNAGDKYRDDDVDIEHDRESDDGYNVGWIAHDEWLSYTIQTEASGSYDMAARVARKAWSGVENTEFRLELNGADITGIFTIPATGNWHDWITIDLGTVFIDAGEHKLVFRALSNNGNEHLGNLNWIRFAPSDSNDQDNVNIAAPNDDQQLANAFIIQAEDYGNDGPGIDYYDAGEGNAGGQYRSDDVDIERSKDNDSGYNVGWINSGEWLAYDFEVKTTATYEITARVARKIWQGDVPAKFTLEIDGNQVNTPVSVNNTGGWHDWATVSVGKVDLSSGTHRMVFKADPNDGRSSLFNVNWFRFIPEGADSTPIEQPADTPTPVIIQAEDYGSDGAGNSYYDSSSGNSGGEYRNDDVDIEKSRDTENGFNVGWITSGEWLKYSFESTATAKYDLKVRVARSLPQGDFSSRFAIEIDGKDVTGYVAVPGTGGWFNWTSIVIEDVDISKGKHEMVFRAEDSGRSSMFNVNWIKILPEGYVDDDGGSTPTPTPPPDPDPDPDPAPGPDPSPVPEPGDDGYSYKQGVGPRAISCSGVTLNPGDNIESASSNNPDGTTFCLKKGTYYQQSVTPKNGQRFIGELGAVLDGQRSKQYAFSGSARDIHIENLVIRNYATPKQMGAIKGGDHGKDSGTYGWKIIRNEIAYNGGGGIRTGHEMLIQGNAVHHNDQIGIAGSGDNTIVEGNEIAYNNYENLYNWGWEAGGTKFVRTDNLIVRNNESHHNRGPGLWTDISNIRTLFENNVVHHNVTGPGIFHEISYDATIRNNHIYDNGWPDDSPTNIYKTRSGIQISASNNVNVYGNLLERNAKGITGVDQCRGTGDYGPYTLTNVNVYNNTIKDSNLSRAGTDCGSTIDYNYYDNTWTGNSYVQK